MNNQEKLKDIDKKIKDLQEKRKQLEHRNLNELDKIIKKIKAEILPPEILAGAISEAVEAFKQKKEILKQWEEKGKTFFISLKKKSGKKEGS